MQCIICKREIMVVKKTTRTCDQCKNILTAFTKTCKQHNIVTSVKEVLSYTEAIDNIPMSERLYLFCNNMKKLPVCKVCGKPVTFRGWTKGGYRNTCCALHGSQYRTYLLECKKHGISTNSFDNIRANTVFLSKEASFSERLFCYKHQLTEQPSCEICERPAKYSIANKTYLCHCEHHIYNSDKTSSAAENELASFITSLGMTVIKNSRSIISPEEVDIYLPDQKIAIEYDGLYWHSSLYKTATYHLEKTNKCVEKGIRLIHIFEDEWLEREFIVKNRLKAILKKTPYRIFARKCKVKTISPSSARLFCEKYHIQGYIDASYRLGLFYKNRMVGLMTFRKDKDGYELSRYCTVGQFTIVGGAGKLLAHFEKMKITSIITTYADLRWSMGNLYEMLGFTFIHNSSPNYFYWKRGYKRAARQRFQKHKLAKTLKVYDENISSAENIKKNDYHIIHDCGNKVYKKITDKK